MLAESDAWTLSSLTKVRRGEDSREGGEPEKAAPRGTGPGAGPARSPPPQELWSQICQPVRESQCPRRQLLTWLVKQPACREVSFSVYSHLVVQVSRQLVATHPVSTGQPVAFVERGPDVRGDPDPAVRRYRGPGKEEVVLGMEKRGFSLRTWAGAESRKQGAAPEA